MKRHHPVGADHLAGEIDRIDVERHRRVIIADEKVAAPVQQRGQIFFDRPGLGHDRGFERSHAPAQVGEQVGQEMERQRVKASDANAGIRDARGRHRAPLGIMRPSDNVACDGDEVLALRCQRDRVLRPIEQFDANPQLERLDAAAQRRLGDMPHLGRA